MGGLILTDYSYEDEVLCERCIWALDPDGLASAAPCDPATWAGSIKEERDRLGAEPAFGTRAGPFPGYVRCAAVMMIKNEADIIYANLGWLYHVGVRRFVVMDNGSEDGTWAEVQRFRAERADVELLAVFDPIVRYVQAGKTSGLCHLARNVWPDVDWIVPVDADEFLISRFGLRALAHVPDDVDALTVQKVVQFRPRGIEESEGDGFIEGMTLRCAPFVLPPKVILRARADLDVTPGNHRASVGDRKLVYAGGLQFGFYLREFQTRNFAQFRMKVVQGGAAILAARAAGFDPGGAHWLALHETLQVGGEDALRTEYETVAYREVGLRMVEDPFVWTI